ncbi:hypothetical protein [Nitrosomonas ureae]|uniref:hypothetical protein n=1 Tax=Nitrosomonas ureae TaxID=44577 RepID=UPI00130D9493|nr:hypothetical protein [Nitrosomonas ureae]
MSTGLQRIAEYIEIFYNRQRNIKDWTIYRQHNFRSDIMQIYTILKPMLHF